MGLRRGAVSLLVNELMRSRLVFEGAKGESKRGRKPRHLYIETRRRFALAVAPPPHVGQSTHDHFY